MRKPTVDLIKLSICHIPWKLESVLSKHLEPFINVDEGWAEARIVEQSLNRETLNYLIG